jgi:hypothetical protein
MSRSTTDPFRNRPLLEIASYARRGPGRRDRLTLAEVALVARTVRGAPEVMVKVLPLASHDVGAVRRHFDYVSRKGELELETDEGERLSGSEIGRSLVEDWDLELGGSLRGATAGTGRPPGKLVHKLMLSMPAGTPSKAVHDAARAFLREEFGLKHRYVFVLHTDEPHPHVHAVVKAVDEDGNRLNVRKATLRRWRSEFARHLRSQGVDANATERAVRGRAESAPPDGLYRAARRAASYLRTGSRPPGPSSPRSSRIDTIAEITKGFKVVGAALQAAGRDSLAAQVSAYVARLESPRSRDKPASEGAGRRPPPIRNR